MVFEINFCAVNFIPYFQIGLITCNERLSKRHLVRLVSSDNLKVFIHSEYSRVTKKELNSPKMYEYSPMDKKGEAIVVGTFLLLGIVALGLYGTYKAVSESRYVLDVSSNTTYDLFKCSINNVDNSNLVYISKEQLDKLDGENYKHAKCSE